MAASEPSQKPLPPEPLAQALSQATPAQKAVGWLFSLVSLAQIALAFWPTAGKNWWLLGGGSALTLLLWVAIGVQRTILPLWLLIGFFVYGLGQSFHVWFDIRLWVAILVAFGEIIGLTAFFVIINILVGGHKKYARKGEGDDPLSPASLLPPASPASLTPLAEKKPE